MNSLNNKLSNKYLNVPQFSVKVSTTRQSYEIADPRSTRALIALMDMHAVIGGAACHFGGPAAFAEIISGLHGVMFDLAKKADSPWFNEFNFVNDAGHCENGIYALRANYKFGGLEFSDLEKFRSIESVLTGHGESHLYPEGVLLSNGPLGSAFPQAQGLAMADNYKKNKRITVCAISDGACMEGEAREAMAAIPGFAKKGQLNPFLLLISDNNTKLGGRIDKDSYPMEGTFSSLTNLGWQLITVENGHDLTLVTQKIEESVSQLRANPKTPIAIRFKTQKGYGSKKAVESSSGGHGFSLKKAAELKDFISEIYSSDKVPELFQNWIEKLIKIEGNHKSATVRNCSSWSTTTEKIQVGVSSAMIQAKKEGLDVVSISADLVGSTGVAGFQKEFPQSSFDIGIAESNMLSVAAGFSKVGMIPVVDTFAQFGVTKGALPLTMAQLSESPMIAIFSHTGFQDAADGASHQALSYLAMMNSIPGVKTFCLSSSSEAHDLVLQALREFSEAQKKAITPPSFVFFLGRENFPKSYSNDKKNNLWKSQVFSAAQTNPKAVLISNGSLLQEALLAQSELEKQNIFVSVVNSPSANHLDAKTILAEIKNAKGNVAVIEDHQKIGGLGSAVATLCAENGLAVKLKIFGVDNEFGRSAYSSLDLYKQHGLDVEAVVNWVKSTLQ